MNDLAKNCENLLKLSDSEKIAIQKAVILAGLPATILLRLLIKIIR